MIESFFFKSIIIDMQNIPSLARHCWERKKIKKYKGIIFSSLKNSNKADHTRNILEKASVRFFSGK